MRILSSKISFSQYGLKQLFYLKKMVSIIKYFFALLCATLNIQYNHIIYKMLQAQQKQDPSAIKGGEAEEISETSSKNNHESNVYYTKNKKIIFWLYLIIGVIFVVSQATLVSKNWENYQNFSASDSFYLANQIANEWGKGFITGIQITNSANCPAGYESAFNFTWPGTSFGCFCQVNANSSFVLQGYCSPKLIQSSCRNIQSKSEIVATIWKNSAHICMKRSSVSFKTQERYNGENKICGSSKSLTIMPSSEPCPFVNATFGIPTLEDHYSRFTDSSNLLSAFYGTFNSTSPYSFYSYPISKFAVSQFEFCLIDEDSGITPDRIEFVLLNQKRGCAESGVYQTLDSITQIQFYANNAQLNALSSTNGFPKPGSETYNLGFANLPSWTYNCRHNYDKKFSIPKALEIINFDFFNSYYYVALVQILLYSVLAFQIFILFIRRLLKKQVYPVGYRQMYLPKDFCLALTRYIIDFVAKFAILGLLIYTAWVIFVNWNWFKSSLNLGCPDNDEKLINNVMEPFRTMYQQSLIYVVSQLFVFAFVAIIDIIHFIYIYRKDLRYYLVDSYGKVMVAHDAKDELDWIDKEGDKKMLNIDNLVEKEGELINDAASEKFRMTMAVHLQDNERIQNEPGKPRIVKKKKKKLGFFKNYENVEAKKQQEQFNPFTMEDPSIIGLNSIDNLSGERKQQDSEEFKNFKKGDRRKRKK